MHQLVALPQTGEDHRRDPETAVELVRMAVVAIRNYPELMVVCQQVVRPRQRQVLVLESPEVLMAAILPLPRSLLVARQLAKTANQSQVRHQRTVTVLLVREIGEPAQLVP